MSEPHPLLQLEAELRAMQQQLRDDRRARLAAAGVKVRRPRDGWPEPPEPPATAAQWARAIVEVAAVLAGGVEHVDVEQLAALAISYLEALPPEQAAPLRELDAQALAEALLTALEADGWLIPAPSPGDD